ncbi:hypothetical protein [Acidithiobacillus sp. HP-11]|uniref:hypothetical protein n=1 Tax=Acidithiobacillus sp. HP-11 TaxID=2697656 RepID=UPI0018791EE4|nr:hypothetical protein [Acidithiobacillus sp. HP-11]MBE7566636.1 hypothetical protein [Acidithiobacillus sp. HP-11]
MKETENRGRVPRLRFPEFREAGKWETGELGNAYIFVKMFMLAQDRDIADLITYEEGR